CDLARLDPFTYNLLANDEVNAIDQDALGKGATRVIHTDDLQVWVKELADGHRAVGVFNLKNEARRVQFAWKDAGMAAPKKVRDLWRQKNLPAAGAAFSADLPAHGCALLKVW
ncbi:MAG: alpha-galactosidase, partial [Saprospiraceae bacterium]|nr:alpha-galactosidase [Saprospiraceae bacterium]